MALRKILSIAVLMWVPTTPGLAGRPLEMGDLVNKRAVVALLNARGVDALDAVYRSLPYTDPAVDITYRTLRLELAPSSEAEIALLDVVPRNPLEYGAFLALGDPDIYNPNVQKLSSIVDGLYLRVARIGTKHRGGVRKFLLLHSFTDGAMRDISDEAYRWLLGHDRMRVLTTLRSLPPATRVQVCGPCLELNQ